MGVKWLAVFFIIAVLISIPAYADTVSEIKQEIENANSEVSSFLEDVPRENLVIIYGSRVSVEDKLIFNIIKSNIPDVQGIEIDPDTFVPAAGDSKKTYILIGSEKTNRFTKKLSEEKNLQLDKKIHAPVILDFATYDGSNKAMILYSQKEVLNNENAAPGKSPLSRIMDKKYVPAAATFLSILFLYLWSILGKTVISLFNDFASSKVITRTTKDKKVMKKHLHELKMHQIMTPLEIASLLATIFVFSIVMSWSYSNDLREFWKVLFMNLMIISAITVMRETVRLFFCYKEKIRSEYRFWPFGTALTFVSTFLGNTFSLVSYTLVDDEHQDERKFGKLSFFISLATLIISFSAYFINIIAPSLFLQLVFVYATMTVFIELFPLPPMAGADIRKWSKSAWLIFYIFVFASYVFMNFTLYV